MDQRLEEELRASFERARKRDEDLRAVVSQVETVVSALVSLVNEKPAAASRTRARSNGRGCSKHDMTAAWKAVSARRPDLHARDAEDEIRAALKADGKKLTGFSKRFLEWVTEQSVSHE